MSEAQTASPPLRAAIVGAGWMGELHAQCLQGVGAEIVGVVDSSELRRERFARGFATVPHPSVADLLQDSDASLIALCTPSGLHAEQAIECLNAGRHVVVEKPIATTVRDGTAMVEAATSSAATLSVILQYRFNRDALRLQRAVAAGLFGDLLFVNVTNYLTRQPGYFQVNGGWRGTWSLNGGGVLINQTTHGMDLLQWCVGPVESVTAAASTRQHTIEVEDTLAALLTFPGGAMGSVQATTAGAEDGPLRLEIVGTEGSAVFERARLTSWKPREDGELLSAAELDRLPPAPSETFGEQFGQAHRRQYAAISRALQEGSQPPVSGDEALGSLRTIERIYASAFPDLVPAAR